MTTPDRDRSVEQWLRQTPIPGATPELCLDADTLAAWSDGTLEGPSRAAAESHAASCGRCQAMLAAMIRTMPAAPAAAPAWSPRRWMMMLAPAAAAAAAVALWVAVGRPTEQSVLQTAATAPAAAEPVPSAGAPAAGAATPPLEKDKAASSLDAPPAPSAAEPKRLADARGERESRVGADTVAAEKTAEKKELGVSNQFRRDERANERKPEGALQKSDEDLKRALGALVAAPTAPTASGAVAETVPAAPSSRVAVATPPPPPPPAPPSPQPQQTQAQGQQQAGARQQSPPGPSAQQQVSVAAERPAAGAAGRGGGIVSGRIAADAIERSRGGKGVVFAEASAPAATVRWHVLDGRVVERSTDDGTTWVEQYTASAGVELVVGSAPSATACWFVGRAGVVVRTADGRTWTLAKFPEQVDLMSVTATDARVATVTTVDGRVFDTTDGGATWRRR